VDRPRPGCVFLARFSEADMHLHPLLPFRESEILDIYHKFLLLYLAKRGVSSETYTRQQLEHDHTAAAAECKPDTGTRRTSIKGARR
jgi:hypothetical protein